jgi:hypothetical protein
MADLLSQKLISVQNVSQNNAYTSSVENKTTTANEERNFRDILRENKTNIIASGLITGGAILLYLGLTRPGKSDIFNKYINGRIAEMVSIVDKFSDFATEKMETAFKESLSYIANYKKTHIVNSEAFISKLKPADTPQKVISAQDTAFGRLYQTFKDGIKNYMDDFSVLFQRIKYSMRGEVSTEQHRTTLKLRDYCTLPHSEKIDEDMIGSAETRLSSKQKSLIDFMERLKNTKTNIAENFQFGQMAEAITESRLSATRTKEAMLDIAFDKIRKMMSLGKDFEPMYKQHRYDLSKVQSLDEYLKPGKIPDEVMQSFEPNMFMEILEKTDLSKLEEKDVNSIFYKMPYDYNLKDLRYLIDRIRLHSIVDAEKSGKVYNAMAIKLEHLSNILNDFGEKELLKRCNFDIEKYNPDLIEARLYRINQVSRRMGYENFSVMNREMLKVNESYADLKLPKFADVIEGNPAKYFKG